jgi:TRAP-type mannitol/chloroaromatic compound transport system substrate-binding protein
VRAGPMTVQSGGWRRTLTPQQVTDVEQVAGIDLRRVGYGA